MSLQVSDGEDLNPLFLCLYDKVIGAQDPRDRHHVMISDFEQLLLYVLTPQNQLIIETCEVELVREMTKGPHPFPWIEMFDKLFLSCLH
jgi:hypothetical protein